MQATAKSRMLEPFADIVERRNHVVLLDGKRGSGKTAALLSMIAVFRKLGSNRDCQLNGFPLIDSEVFALDPMHFRRVPPQTSVALTIVQRRYSLVETLSDGCRPDWITSDENNLTSPDVR
jgi:ABC-type lipoprotein export system ATPase subunit